jgi:hypothetical protein
MKKQAPKHKYEFKICNGNIKVCVDGYVMFAFNQIDYAGHYAYKDGTNLYGLDIYMNREKAGQCQMEIYFKSKETWLAVNKLLDENL